MAAAYTQDRFARTSKSFALRSKQAAGMWPMKNKNRSTSQAGNVRLRQDRSAAAQFTVPLEWRRP
ncbi:hypothetical protein XI06_06575 [Bradyrhizobium sp. CCBAU 11434]|nr:hypothetical protein [Bradyrhizobium sp. CCBAU 11434]